MNRNIARLILAASLTGAVGLGLASQGANPSPIDAVSNLKKLTGDWVANATLTIDGKPHKIEYHLSGHEIAAGSGIYVDEWFTDKELGTLRGGNMIGYNPYDDRIHWYSVDNQGTTHEHIGTWTAPDHLVVEHDSTRDGKSYVEKLDVVVRSAGELDFHPVGTLGGQEVEKGEGVFRRVAGARR